MLGDDIKKLGFGLMRPPMLGDAVDIEQLKQMVDLFLSSGFTYFDTAYGYLNGASESAAKTALVERHPRASFQLATKLPAWAGPTTAKEAQDMLWTSLERTGAEYFDFYLLHNLGGSRTEAFDRFGIWEFLAEQKRRGVIKHLGFSMHAKSAELDAVLREHPEMEFVQLQINYADWDSEVVESRKCFETAKKHNKPVVIMEPVKGGALASLPKPAAEILRAADPAVSQASWAIRYAASLPGIITVLSGMSSLEQMRDNVSYMKSFSPLSEAERKTVERVRAVLAGIPQIPCTDCQYCTEGCPEHINIPGAFEAFNDYLVYNDIERAKGSYGFALMRGARASACIECGACEAVCPQSIAIIDELKRAAALLEG